MCEFSLWGFRIDVFHSTVFRVCQQARTRAKTNCQIWTRHGRGESAVAVKKFETNRIYITLSLCPSYYVSFFLCALCLSFFLFYSYFTSLFLSPSLSFYLSIYFCLFSLSLSLFAFLFLSMFLSFSLCICNCLPLSFFLSLSLSEFALFVSPSLRLSVLVNLFLTFSLPV